MADKYTAEFHRQDALDEIDTALKKYGLPLKEKELTMPYDLDSFLDGSKYILKLSTRGSLGLINNGVMTIRQLLSITKWELRSKFKNHGETVDGRGNLCRPWQMQAFLG